MARDKNDIGKYRLTLVGATGISTRQQFTSWKKARTAYSEMIKYPKVVYAILVDMTDDDQSYWRIRGRRTRDTLRLFTDP